MPEIVKPKPWDFGALVIAGIGVVLTGANLAIATSASAEGAVSGGVTTIFVVVQLVICSLSLMALGKTAKVGTIWGNLFALGGCFVGMSGVLLASALWALA
ncbi:MAG: hypothetical protein R3190_14835 [Thermoanaerobaculia bacterium]|nr:hypothetical protein [Thermoanaerobaculia bacterium]